MEENHFQLTTAQQHLIHSYRYGNVASLRFLPSCFFSCDWKTGEESRAR